MAKIKAFLSRLQFTYLRSRNLTKVMIIIVIILSMGALTMLRLSSDALNQRTDALREQAMKLEESNREIREDLNEVGTVKSVVEIAEEELGLVQPGTVIFQPEE